MAILIDGTKEECADVRIMEAQPSQREEDRYRRLLAAWIALGNHLAESIAGAYKTEKTEANRAFILLAELIDNMVQDVIHYIQVPQDLAKHLVLAEMATRFKDQLEQKITEAAAEPSRKFGTN